MVAILTVWPDKYPKSFPLDIGDVGTLPTFASSDVDAFDTVYPTDAHFVPYTVHGQPECPRLNKRAANLCTPLFGLLVADVDAPGHVATDAWQQAELDKVAELPDDATDHMGYYQTKGGYRLLARLPQQVGIDEFVRLQMSFRAFLLSVGIVADEACKDWTRCYRMPYVYRDNVQQDYPATFSGLRHPFPLRIFRK